MNADIEPLTNSKLTFIFFVKAKIQLISTAVNELKTLS